MLHPSREAWVEALVSGERDDTEVLVYSLSCKHDGLIYSHGSPTYRWPYVVPQDRCGQIGEYM